MPLPPTGWRAWLTRGWILRSLLALRGSILTPLGRGWQRELAVIRQTRALVPLLMSDAAALQIQICVRAVRSLDGAMAEAGVFKGGSARLICEAKGDVPLHLFDVFDTLQKPKITPSDSEVAEHFGRVHGVRREVEQLLAPYANVHFHPGLFPDSIPGELADERFTFVHIDLDLPGSIAAALKYFHPKMVAGGMILLDDYADNGVRTVTESYFSNAEDTILELPWGQAMVFKRS